MSFSFVEKDPDQTSAQAPLGTKISGQLRKCKPQIGGMQPYGLLH